MEPTRKSVRYDAPPSAFAHAGFSPLRALESPDRLSACAVCSDGDVDARRPKAIADRPSTVFADARS